MKEKKPKKKSYGHCTIHYDKEFFELIEPTMRTLNQSIPACIKYLVVTGVKAKRGEL